MPEHCRYDGQIAHVCTTSFGAPIHGEQVCQYEARAQLRDMESRGVNERQLTIRGTLVTGDPVTIVMTVPASFAAAWKAGAGG